MKTFIFIMVGLWITGHITYKSNGLAGLIFFAAYISFGIWIERVRHRSSKNSK